jgi:membrane-associated protease RseP (regulator of RpoE activity)
LLLPVSVGSAFSTLAEISELNHDRDEYIGRTVCARIDTHHAVGGGATLWIERETCLLRRILTTRASGLGTTIDYEPSLHPIDVGNMERPDVEKMQPQPRKPRPWTGIGFENISRRVARMEPGSPASRSSLAIGDEVEAVNGHPTDRLTDFLDALREVSVGEQVTLTIRRGGNTQEILMQVEAAPPRVTPSPSSPLVE